MKVVDTREYVDVLRGLTEAGEEVGMLIAGGSMVPFLVHGRDYIYFKKPTEALKAGDMVFFQRRNGQYVMHRIIRIKNGKYYIVGDAQQDIEGPVDEDQIFAIITKVKRKGKILEKGSFWWNFFEGPWLWLYPLRPLLRKVYGLFAGIRDQIRGK